MLNNIRNYQIKNKNLLYINHIIQLILYAVSIYLFVEILSRRSILEGLKFIVKNPIIFFYNLSIVIFTLSLSYLFTRRKFIFSIISFLWIGLGLVNGVILCFRLTPFSAMDLYGITAVADLAPGYLLVMLVMILLVILILVIRGFLILWRRAKKEKILIKVSIPIVVISAMFVLFFSFATTKMNRISNRFDNLHDAYKEYGFVYCFSNSILDRGIDKPNDYSKERIQEILEEIQDKSSQSTERDTVQGVETPNIIMVQLESFFDTSLLKNYLFSENPVPIFTKLKAEYTTGYLRVPVYGAGTVNTEFEVITGMSTAFFGAGEYPYRTILASTTCESICYNLSKLGYHNYVIHNNEASFYKRSEVFKMLGFDNFVSMEYMDDVQLNPIGWAKDEILTKEIMKALQAKETKDFIYTISVQDHGIYPDTYTKDNGKIKVTLQEDIEESVDKEKTGESYINQLTYYVNQIKETDTFIGDLTGALEAFDEPTVVVFYGDHLPPLSLENTDLYSDRYDTEYVMWSNFSLDREYKDLTAYQLNAYVLDRVGIAEGIITQFHQAHSTPLDSNDLKDLKLLQYDMLYGKQYVYKGKNPYPVKDMKMGMDGVNGHK